jgi:choline dehydrogenase-like flavoprotein
VEVDSDYDVIIVVVGIAPTMPAYSLMRDRPQVKVLMIEGGRSRIA